jgi:hypothetical protein
MRAWFAKLLVVLGMVVPSVMLFCTPVAHAWAPPPIVTGVPTAAAGAEVVASGAGVLVGQGLVVAGAGVGAFENTCWFLGHAASALGSSTMNCHNGWNTILDWIGFGGSGDTRSQTKFGFSATHATPVVNGNQQAQDIPMNNTETAFWRITCADPTTGANRHDFFTFAFKASSSGDYGAQLGCSTASQNPTIALGQVPNSTFCGSVSISCTFTPTPSTQVLEGIEVWKPSGLTCSAWNGPTTCSAYAPLNPNITAAWFSDINPNQPWSDTYTVTCRKPGGITASASVTTTETPTANGHFAPTLPDCSTILPGGHIDVITVTGGRQGTSPPEVQVTLPTFTPAATASYPACTSGAAAACQLILKRNGLSCFAGAWCAGWLNYQSEMSCTWGPYAVPIAWCVTDYGTSFDTQLDPATDPAQQPSASPGAFPSAGTNIDPRTGLPTGTPTTTPLADPLDTAGANCMGGAWSWNPVNWVYIPIKCGLQWAFLPDESTLNALKTQVGTAIATVGITDWFTSIGGLFGDLGGATGGSGCDGPGVTFPITHTAMHPFAACDPPMSVVAGISYAFTSMTVVVVGGMAGLRAIGMAFGFNINFGRRHVDGAS